MAREKDPVTVTPAVEGGDLVLVFDGPVASARFSPAKWRELCRSAARVLARELAVRIAGGIELYLPEG